jgi:hypothetical protein
MGIVDGVKEFMAMRTLLEDSFFNDVNEIIRVAV